MCTVSWIHEPGGYQLLCNRDEKRTRKAATPPQVSVSNGVRYVAPSDGDFGGSWIVTNEFGVSLCLLNGYSWTALPRRKSRGLLLLELSDADSLHTVAQRVSRADLSVHAPFIMTVLQPDEPAMVIEWDGTEKLIEANGDSRMPLVSSSYDPVGVRQRRSSDFQMHASVAGEVAGKLLYSFHASHGAQPDAYSPCMHREDAETVSFSWVRVTATKVDFFYTPGAPCLREPGEHVTLERSWSN
jgi:hypothetical protein